MILEKAIHGKIPEEKEFIDTARLVYEGVREIRRTVLLNRNFNELDSDDADFETDIASTLDSRPESTLPLNSQVDEFPEIAGVKTAREAMRKLPEEDRAKIAEQVEVFRVEKRKFDMEVSKWDDNGNSKNILFTLVCKILYTIASKYRRRGRDGPTYLLLRRGRFLFCP